ncbi:hypothetical protein Tco_0616233, partial [Tanacetum coccineum]
EPKTIDLDSCESNSSVESLESIPKLVIIEPKTSNYASCKSNLSAESPEFFPKSVCARNESVRKADNPRKNNKSPRVEMVINPPWIMPLLGTKGLASPKANGFWALMLRDVKELADGVKVTEGEKSVYVEDPDFEDEDEEEEEDGNLMIFSDSILLSIKAMNPVTVAVALGEGGGRGYWSHLKDSTNSHQLDEGYPDDLFRQLQKLQDECNSKFVLEVVSLLYEKLLNHLETYL